MRRLRLLVCAVVGTVLSMSLAVPVALANPNPPPEPFHTGHESPNNIYVATGGHAHIRFTPYMRKKLVEEKIHIRYIEPWTNLPGEPPEAGLAMPVGSKYDAIQLDTRFTYPGGFVFTIQGKDGKAHTFSANGASLVILPVLAGFYVAPWVDERREGKNVKILGASFMEALVADGFFAWHPEEKAWGPTNVNLKATPELTKMLDELDFHIETGKTVAKITVRWSGRPEWKD